MATSHLASQSSAAPDGFANGQQSPMLHPALEDEPPGQWGSRRSPGGASSYFCSLQMIIPWNFTSPPQFLQKDKKRELRRVCSRWTHLKELASLKHRPVHGIWGLFSVDQTGVKISLDMLGLLPWNTHVFRIDIFIQSFLKWIIRRCPQAGVGKRAGPPSIMTKLHLTHQKTGWCFVNSLAVLFLWHSTAPRPRGSHYSSRINPSGLAQTPL